MRVSLWPSGCIGMWHGFRNRAEPVSPADRGGGCSAPPRVPAAISPILELSQLKKSASSKVTSAFRGSLYPRTGQHRGTKAQPPAPNSGQLCEGPLQLPSSHWVHWPLHRNGPSSTSPLSYPAVLPPPTPEAGFQEPFLISVPRAKLRLWVGFPENPTCDRDFWQITYLWASISSAIK